MQRKEYAQPLIQNHWAPACVIQGIDDETACQIREAINKGDVSAWEHFDIKHAMTTFLACPSVSSYTWGYLQYLVQQLYACREHDGYPHPIALKPLKSEDAQPVPHLDAVYDTGVFRFVNASGRPVSIYTADMEDATTVPSTSALTTKLFAEVWTEVTPPHKQPVWCVIITPCLLPPALDAHDPDSETPHSWRCLTRPWQQLTEAEQCVRRAIVAFIKTALRSGAPAQLRFSVAELV